MKNKITINCQSSIRIISSKIIYFDPFKITNPYHDADIIFITHDHFDHFDIISLTNLLKDDTKLVIPKSILKVALESELKWKEIIFVEPNNKYEIDDISFLTIPSYNTKSNFHPLNKGYVGYVITCQDEKIYVAGDTDITKEALEVKCDIALIPIGGTYTMDYQEAAKLVNHLKPQIVIPTHYKTIVGNDKDVALFEELLDKDISCLKLY